MSISTTTAGPQRASHLASLRRMDYYPGPHLSPEKGYLKTTSLTIYVCYFKKKEDGFEKKEFYIHGSGQKITFEDLFKDDIVVFVYKGNMPQCYRVKNDDFDSITGVADSPLELEYVSDVLSAKNLEDVIDHSSSHFATYCPHRSSKRYQRPDPYLLKKAAAEAQAAAQAQSSRAA